MKSNIKVYIFTDYFPYGSGEQFLDQELKIATNYFSEVILLPRFKTENQRLLPSGVSVNNSCTDFSKVEMLWVVLINFGFITQWSRFFKKLITSSFGFLPQLKAFLSYNIESSIIKNRIKALDSTAIYYSYWLKHAAFAIADSKGLLLKIARGHGSDIYPIKYDHFLQENCVNNLDQTFTVSEAGRNYLKSKYNNTTSKITVAYLGTIKEKVEFKNLNESFISNRNCDYNILSCSALIPLKRVNTILTSLILLAQQNPSIKFSWKHIGDGLEFEKISALTKAIPNNFEVTLLGAISNEKLHEYYLNHRIDCFVNFSTSEGIPVSIMEALSYGVPIVASDVGGNTEIVRPQVGKIIDPNSSNQVLADAIFDVVSNKGKYTKEHCLLVWSQNFNASINYPKFYENLLLMANAKTKSESN